MKEDRRLFLASFGSEILFTAVLIFLAPLVLWLYGPETIGSYGKFQAGVAVAAVFATLRLELTITSDKRNFHQVLSASSFQGAILTIAIAIIIVVVSKNVNTYVDITLHTILIAIAAWQLGYVNLFNYYFVAIGAKKSLVYSKLMRVSILLMLQIPLAYIFDLNNYYFLVVSFIVSLTAFNIVSYKRSRISIPLAGRMQLGRECIANNINLIAANVPAALIIALHELLLISVIARHSAYLAGIYFVADRLLKTPISMLNQTIRQFILANRVNDIKKLLRVALSIIFMTALCIIVISHIIKESSLKSLPKEFIDVFYNARVLFVYYASSCICSILISESIRLKKNRYSLVYSMLLISSTALTGAFESRSEIDPLYTFVFLSTLFTLFLGIYLYYKLLSSRE